MKPIKSPVTSLNPCGRGSIYYTNQSATQFRFWTDFSRGNEVYFILGSLRTDFWSQGRPIVSHCRIAARTNFLFLARFTHARCSSRMIEWFLNWGDHGKLKSGKIKGRWLNGSHAGSLTGYKLCVTTHNNTQQRERYKRQNNLCTWPNTTEAIFWRQNMWNKHVLFCRVQWERD